MREFSVDSQNIAEMNVVGIIYPGVAIGFSQSTRTPLSSCLFETDTGLIYRLRRNALGGIWALVFAA